MRKLSTKCTIEYFRILSSWVPTPMNEFHPEYVEPIELEAKDILSHPWMHTPLTCVIIWNTLKSFIEYYHYMEPYNHMHTCKHSHIKRITWCVAQTCSTAVNVASIRKMCVGRENEAHFAPNTCDVLDPGAFHIPPTHLLAKLFTVEAYLWSSTVQTNDPEQRTAISLFVWHATRQTHSRVYLRTDHCRIWICERGIVSALNEGFAPALLSCWCSPTDTDADESPAEGLSN